MLHASQLATVDLSYRSPASPLWFHTAFSREFRGHLGDASPPR